MFLLIDVIEVFEKYPGSSRVEVKTKYLGMFTSKKKAKAKIYWQIKKEWWEDNMHILLSGFYDGKVVHNYQIVDAEEKGDVYKGRYGHEE